MFEDQPNIKVATDLAIIEPKNLTFSSTKVKEVVPYWEPEYINRRIDAVKNQSHRMFIKFLWMTGVRITEALNVKKGDIDFEGYVLRIRWQKNRRYSNRNVPLYPTLRDVLQLFTGNMNLDERLFNFGRIRGYQIVKQHLGGNPHKLRHSFAVNWLRCGGDVYMLKRYLGHLRLETTENYLQVVPADQAKEFFSKVKF